MLVSEPSLNPLAGVEWSGVGVPGRNSGPAFLSIKPLDRMTGGRSSSENKAREDRLRDDTPGDTPDDTHTHLMTPDDTLFEYKERIPGEGTKVSYRRIERREDRLDQTHIHSKEKDGKRGKGRERERVTMVTSASSGPGGFQEWEPQQVSWNAARCHAPTFTRVPPSPTLYRRGLGARRGEAGECMAEGLNVSLAEWEVMIPFCRIFFYTRMLYIICVP
ncbi:hypothetical protein E2C01_094576 [Portunus trituberculatus]|uniref:Uncharacterized protein n=1 Tax=Portunus trituberculatus TaxID=210409 RepID=A0A5B7JWG2_PORTR|nr:hypothetical protein [Portunus trituberculatus]